MKPERYKELELGNLALTEQEMADGWHWCYDWDYMLVGPEMPEMKVCTCGEDDGLTREERGMNEEKTYEALMQRVKDEYEKQTSFVKSSLKSKDGDVMLVASAAPMEVLLTIIRDFEDDFEDLLLKKEV